MTCKHFNHSDLYTLRYLYTSTNNQMMIPSSFSWHIITSSDSPTIRAKKKLITAPPNQYLCGSCWAVATTTCMSDKFVVSGIVDWNPDISATYALSNFPQGQCSGGDPVALLHDICKNGGLPSKHCIDYSWCSQTSSCSTGDASSHFGQDLSSLLPPKASCYFDNTYYHYNVDPKSIRTIVSDNNTDDENAVNIINVQKTIQEHILIHGPVIAGLLIFKNFISGKFTQKNGGIYLEKANDDGVFSSSSISTNNFIGGHAVVVVGWGIGTNIKIGNGINDYTTVPYWICRNSWGSSWGDKGFFKIAMFPHNRKVQFSKIVHMKNDSGLNLKLGGVLTFSLAGYPTKKFLKSIDRPLSFKLEQDKNWYRNMLLFKSETQINDILGVLNIQQHTKYVILTLTVTVIILFIIILFIYLLRKKVLYKKKVHFV
jgi:hypothetical protein